MSEPERLEPVPIVQRAWLVATQVPLVLPYLVVTRCDESTPQELTGLELYFSKDGGPLGLVLLVLFAVLFTFVWRGERDGTTAAGLGLRAFVAGFGTLFVAGGPVFAFLFDNVVPRLGWWLHGLGWGVTMLMYSLLAVVGIVAGWGPQVTDPKPRSAAESTAIIAVAIITPLAVVVNPLFNEPDLAAIPYYLLAGFLVNAPIVLTGIALARARRAGVAVRGYQVLWWPLVAATLLFHAFAAVAD